MNDPVLVNVPKNLVIPLFHQYFGEIAAVSTREQVKLTLALQEMTDSFLLLCSCFLC